MIWRIGFEQLCVEKLCMDPVKQVATPILFIYVFRLKNMRRDVTYVAEQ